MARTSTTGTESMERLCSQCDAILHPIEHARMEEFRAELRRKAFERPMNFEAFRRNYLDRDPPIATEHLTSLADQIAEHLSINKQIPPEDVRLFIERYRSSARGV